MYCKDLFPFFRRARGVSIAGLELMLIIRNHNAKAMKSL